jgi:hypothetical protein
VPGADGFYPPVQYSAVWVVIGILILLLIAGWYVFVWVSTRRRREQIVPDPLAGTLPPTSVRDTYLRLIDDVQRAHHEGSLSFGDAHQRLGLIVREFAAQARGIRAPYMTLDDLRAHQLTPLSATVGELYPGAFSGHETGSVAAAAERARRLVIEWR